MSPDDDNCPFKLSNLTFVLYSDCITQQKARKGKHHGKMMSLGNVSYEQSQSALKHLFSMIKYAMSADFLTASSSSRRASGNTLLIRKYAKAMLPLLERRRRDSTCTKQFASWWWRTLCRTYSSYILGAELSCASCANVVTWLPVTSHEQLQCMCWYCRGLGTVVEPTCM